MLSKNKIVVGLMSGTALDGVDVALLSVLGKGTTVQYKLIAFDTYPYDQALKDRILQASQIDTSNVALITELHYELGVVYSRAIQKLLDTIQFKQPLDLIGLHGQTIHHLPNALYPSTLQIGNASKLAYDFETTVVSNFREMDLVAGGEGAPLVPYIDYVLYRDDTQAIGLQNIGGIANLTIIPKKAQLKDIYAFDTGPGNMMINAATQYFYQEPYDHNGQYAKQGVLIDSLYQELCNHAYLFKAPPKSTGREMFGEDFTTRLCEKHASRPHDVIHTLTQYTAETIWQSYRDFVLPNHPLSKLIVSGGGAYNPVLMDELKSRFTIPVLTQEDLGHSSDAKEAIAFALLANDTIQAQANNVPSATGAHESVILGQITLNPKR